MIDISCKPETERRAQARARLVMASATLERIRQGRVEKGDVLGVARMGAIQAVKHTPLAILLAHPIRMTGVWVEFAVREDPCALEIFVRVGATDRTGPEMEALVGAAAAALNVYDMCKAIDRSMRLEEVVLLSKEGGRSGSGGAPEPSGPEPERAHQAGRSR